MGRSKKPNLKRRGTSWELDYGLDSEKKRVRRSFKTKKEAETAIAIWVKEHSNDQIKLTHLTNGQRMDVLSAFDILNGHSSLTEAARYFMTHLGPGIEPISLKDLLSAYIDTKKKANRRPRTIDEIKKVIPNFMRHFGLDKMVHEATVKNVEAWLDSLNVGSVTWNGYKQVLSGFFNFAIKRKYIRENPVAGLENVAVDEKLPQLMDVTDVIKLFKALQQHEPELIPYFAIGFFAGLRPVNELGEFCWENINFESKMITVLPATAKKRRQRHVDMSDNLLAWLTPFRKKQGPIFFHDRRARNLRNEAGIVWTPDVMRHSFASFHLALHGDITATSMQLGHTRINVLLSHYRNIRTPKGTAVTKDYAQQYWNIRPDNLDSEAINQTAV